MVSSFFGWNVCLHVIDVAEKKNSTCFCLYNTVIWKFTFHSAVFDLHYQIESNLLAFRNKNNHINVFMHHIPV